MDSDDDDRVLGLRAENSDDWLHNTSGTAAAATANDGEGAGDEIKEEEFLDLGPPTDEDDDDDDGKNNNDDDDENDAVMDEDSQANDNGSNASNDDDVGSRNGEPLSDEALVRIESKSEAKALGRKLYKRWKKLHRRSKKERHRHDSKKKSMRDDKKHEKRNEKRKRKRTHDDDDDDNDFMEELQKEEEEKRKGSKAKRQRKVPRHEKPIALGDEDLGSAPFADLDEVLLTEEAAARRSGGHSGKGGRGNSSNNMVSETKPKKLSADAQRDALRSMAAALVNSMREARLQDEVDMNQHRPPLHRVGILDKVVIQCRREALRPFLIEEGILQELSTWLYDFTRRELAAFELRSAALDILLGFPIDGELNSGIARNGDEILDAFTGMSREHLIHTDLGSAVNALRQDKREVHQNRSKAVRLLERLSRAISGGVRSARRRGDGSGNSFSAAGGGGASSGTVTWKCQDDPTVAPPFHMVQTGTEVFQTALVRPDPLDPLSYLRVPPRRVPKAYVTNMGGNVGIEE